jgi:hypothetical protein
VKHQLACGAWAFPAALLISLSSTEGWAQQTDQQDRRIEEEKRESLKPTLATPPPPTPGKERAMPELPVPLPSAAAFFSSLAPKHVTFRYDAAKAIVILMGVDEQYIDLSAQVAYLGANRLLPRRFQTTFDPMAPLRKGLFAYMVYQALDLHGGIALHLFGPTERLALKELVFQGLMSPGHVHDLVSGQELVQVMSQAARYKLARVRRHASR